MRAGDEEARHSRASPRLAADHPNGDRPDSIELELQADEAAAADARSKDSSDAGYPPTTDPLDSAASITDVSGAVSNDATACGDRSIASLNTSALCEHDQLPATAPIETQPRAMEAPAAVEIDLSATGLRKAESLSDTSDDWVFMFNPKEALESDDDSNSCASVPTHEWFLEDKFDVCTLHYFIRRLDAYEPGLVDAVRQDVATRQYTASERLAMETIMWAESRGVHFCRKVMRKIALDKKRPRGFGPQPSLYKITARSVCGASCADSTAKCVDPAVRGCLCITYDEYGRKRDNRRLAVVKAFLVKNASRLAIMIDIADIVVDLTLVGRLERRGHTGYAALMCCAVLVAIPVEINVKASLVRLLEDRPLEESDDYFKNFLFFFALTELTIFLLEDATSIFCWYNTSVFDPGDTLSLVNMYLTVISGLMAGLGLIYPTVNVVVSIVGEMLAARRTGERFYLIPRRETLWAKIRSALTFMYYTTLFFMILAMLGFWCFVALGIVQHETMEDQPGSVNRAVRACFVLGFGTAMCGLWSFYYNFWRDVPPCQWYIDEFKAFISSVRRICACQKR